MLFRHGLVIGKFYPPHAGHEYLIRTAATLSNQVTVVVMAADHETLPLSYRVRFLRETFASWPQVAVSGIVDNLPVDYEDDAIWGAQVALMREGIALADSDVGRAMVAVDAVFTSEDYGTELARRFGAVAVCLDRDRVLYPVSGSAVRRDPAANWDFLAPAVRAYFTRRVVLLGAESTGTTTLARALQDAYRQRGGVWARTRLVPEYGREYSINLLAAARGVAIARGAPEPRPEDLTWHSPQFHHVAQVQTEWEEAAARDGGPLLLCDTDALATCLWHERYVGAADAELEAFATTLPPRALYLLTDIAGVPFVDDGLRDGAHVREGMHHRFIERLAVQATPWALVSGDADTRISRAVDLIDALLRGG
ncbi:MAG: AAA family ATPase [Rhodospirillaceae bacterium]|nr:AAA family ATPase [Rhodospirillaceae bacterium]